MAKYKMNLNFRQEFIFGHIFGPMPFVALACSSNPLRNDVFKRIALEIETKVACKQNVEV